MSTHAATERVLTADLVLVSSAWYSLLRACRTSATSYHSRVHQNRLSSKPADEQIPTSGGSHQFCHRFCFALSVLWKKRVASPSVVCRHCHTVVSTGFSWQRAHCCPAVLALQFCRWNLYFCTSAGKDSRWNLCFLKSFQARSAVSDIMTPHRNS